MQFHQNNIRRQRNDMESGHHRYGTSGYVADSYYGVSMYIPYPTMDEECACFLCKRKSYIDCQINDYH